MTRDIRRVTVGKDGMEEGWIHSGKNAKRGEKPQGTWSDSNPRLSPARGLAQSTTRNNFSGMFKPFRTVWSQQQQQQQKIVQGGSKEEKKVKRTGKEHEKRKWREIQERTLFL